MGRAARRSDGTVIIRSGAPVECRGGGVVVDIPVGIGATVFTRCLRSLTLVARIVDPHGELTRMRIHKRVCSMKSVRGT
ncbi:hypothetical protein STSO111631_04875 [Stackebrandtia soli]